MRLLTAPLVLVALVSVVAAAPPHKSTMVPQIVELDACVLPAEGCEERALEVLDISIEGRTLRLAVQEIRVVGGTELGTSLLADLRGRPVRLMGPDDMTERLVAGRRLRLRAALRSGTYMLLLQGVEALEADRDR